MRNDHIGEQGEGQQGNVELGRSIIENNNIKETIALGGKEKQLHSMVEREEGKAEPCTVVQFQWQGEVSAW